MVAGLCRACAGDAEPTILLVDQDGGICMLLTLLEVSSTLQKLTDTGADLRHSTFPIRR